MASSRSPSRRDGATGPKRLAPLDHIKTLYDGAAASLTGEIATKKDLVDAVKEMNASGTGVQSPTSAAEDAVSISNSKQRNSSLSGKASTKGNRNNAAAKPPRKRNRIKIPTSNVRIKSAKEILQETLNTNSRKYNELKVTSEVKDQELKKMVDELEGLRIENASLIKMEKHETADTSKLDELQGLIDEESEVLDQRLHRKRVLKHMKDRLDKNQVAFNAHIRTMEEALEASKREFDEVKNLMRQLESGNSAAQEALKSTLEKISKERDLRNKHLAQRRQEAANAKRMEEWREQREKARMLLNAELNGDLGEEGETRLIAAVHESAQQDHELELIHRHTAQTISTYEEAFNAIREATGVRSLDEMVEKFLGQSANKEALMEEKKEVEARQMVIKEELSRVQKEFSELKSVGIGGSELNREMYDQLDNNILEARHELKIKQGMNERLEEVLIQVRAGMLGLAARLAPFSQVLGFEDGDALSTKFTGDEILDVTMSCEMKLLRLLDTVSVHVPGMARSQTLHGRHSFVAIDSARSEDRISEGGLADSLSKSMPKSISKHLRSATLETLMNSSDGCQGESSQQAQETSAEMRRHCQSALSLVDPGGEVNQVNNVRVRPRRAFANGDMGTPLSTARSKSSETSEGEGDGEDPIASTSEERIFNAKIFRRNPTKLLQFSKALAQFDDHGKKSEDVEEEKKTSEAVMDAAALKAQSKARVQKVLEEKRSERRQNSNSAAIPAKRRGNDQEAIDRLARPSKHHVRATRESIFTRPDLS